MYTSYAYPYTPSYSELQLSLSKQVGEWLYKVGWGELQGDIAEAIKGVGATASEWGSTVRSLVAHIKHDCECSVFARLDRDARRAASMDLAGFWLRLRDGYLAGDGFFTRRLDLTPEDAVQL